MRETKVRPEIIPGKIYQKGNKKRYVIGFESYFVLYRSVSNRPRTVGQARWDFEKWMKGAEIVAE